MGRDDDCRCRLAVEREAGIGWFRRVWFHMTHFKCDWCLEYTRRPGYRTKDDLATICFDRALIEDEL